MHPGTQQGGATQMAGVAGGLAEAGLDVLVDVTPRKGLGEPSVGERGGLRAVVRDTLLRLLCGKRGGPLSKL